MPEKKTIQEKLLFLQAELKAPKQQFNAFGKYKYRSCEDILEAVKPLLKEVGVTLVLKDDIVLIGDRHYVKAVTQIDDGERAISASAFAREALTKKGMDEAQITGSASSYARKYALNGLFAIDDAKEIDGEKQTPKDDVMEIIHKAFEEFQKANLPYLEEHEQTKLSMDKFIKAIHKEFGQLPTQVESIPKIIKKLKLSDVIEEEFDAGMANTEGGGER